MKKQFIPYKQALKLKELGFDEKCLGYYEKDKNGNYFVDTFIFLDDGKNRNSTAELNMSITCTAILWQQAFDWFRYNYKLDGYIYQENRNSFIMTLHYIMQNDSKSEYDKHLYKEYRLSTYQEARLACLDKLIEITQQK